MSGTTTHAWTLGNQTCAASGVARQATQQVHIHRKLGLPPSICNPIVSK